MNKYRGIRVDNGEWIYGYLIGKDVIVGDIIDFDDEYFTTEFWYKVIPETVEQFTGLHDKNGVEIYTGDKVIIENEDDEGMFVVKWDNNTARFIIDSEIYVLDFDNCYGTDCEVIGNIHERSEDNDK